MLQYRSFEEIIDHPGLRMVLVKGVPSPWGQAAKTIFEIKGLDYVAAPWLGGEPNADIAAWSGATSAPIVAWAKEKPINRWIDILYLAERIAPKPSLIPADAMQRALMIGLSHEICGEMGIGWNRRLQLFAPAFASGNPPPKSAGWASKYGYQRKRRKAAGERTAASLNALATATQIAVRARGALFCRRRLERARHLLDGLRQFARPLAEGTVSDARGLRPGFTANDPIVKAALDPLLLEHRSRIFRAHFRDPMEL